MRVLLFLVFLIGLAVGVGYPYVIRNFSGHEIGTWRVYDQGAGFKPADAKLAATDAPVRVVVDLTAIAAPTVKDRQSALTVTVATGGRTILAETLNFSKAKVIDDSPQTAEKIYRDQAGVISDVTDGDYTFTVRPGDADNIDMVSVDLVLLGGAGAYDERAQPIGLTLMAVGFIGFVLAMRRRGQPPQNPNSQPPKPRWGRGGDAA
jgi:hypothetical protein